MPNHNMTSQKHADAIERQRQALELRKAGYGFQVIADRLQYADASGAYRAVRRALLRTIQQPADEVRQLELERLDKMMSGLWQAAISGKWLAIDRVLLIMDRRARLLGLDAPTKIDITQRIREVAEEAGLDPDLAVKEAMAIVASRR